MYSLTELVYTQVAWSVISDVEVGVFNMIAYYVLLLIYSQATVVLATSGMFVGVYLIGILFVVGCSD
jgi:hypothetical protein